MTRLVIAMSLVIAMRGEARSEVVAYDSPPVFDPNHGDFWREIVEPHADEVRAITMKARAALQQADQNLGSEYEHVVEYRDHVYTEVFGMLRYARRLAPENIEVLRLLGQAADGIGKTRQAIEALQTAIQLVGADKAGPDVTGRLGAIYLRLGQLDDAIRYLRLAQGPVGAGLVSSAYVLLHLSTALALRGETSEAIDVLSNSLPSALPGYYPNDVLLVDFALAVQYDRDEQRGAAFDVLDRLTVGIPGQLGQQMQTALASMRFAPAEDQHYYLGLLYETIGSYSEARAEWVLYAASGGAWRGRALEHVAAIDAERRAPPPPMPLIVPQLPTVRLRGIP
jgi:tetratricopeptide (TPR) repeat protein